MAVKSAPKGRIRAPVNPMDDSAIMDGYGTPYIPCTATSKQSGQRCKRRPIPGGRVCKFHGGGAPAVRANALERLRALQEPAIATLSYLMEQKAVYPSTAYQAAKDVLDRTEGRAGEKLDLTVKGDADLIARLTAARARLGE